MIGGKVFLNIFTGICLGESTFSAFASKTPIGTLTFGRGLEEKSEGERGT